MLLGDGMLSFLHSFFTMKAYLPKFRIEKLLPDSAHDAYAVYDYCRRENITPFIDLNPGHTGHFTYKDRRNTAGPYIFLRMTIQGCLTYRQGTLRHGKRNMMQELPWNAPTSGKERTTN